MATRYESFEGFMCTVIETAKERASTVCFADILWRNLVIIISKGWWVFLGLCALLALGSVSFVLAITPFLITGVGLIVAAALGIACIPVIKALYDNRELPFAIKTVGENYKPCYQKLGEPDADNSNRNKEVDHLFELAVNDLLITLALLNCKI